ncbi:hypothetical protein HHL19_01700 [Streptomyces sp. R302]|uniref:hypothetical protein n=1 Tax=unclassified Streptomyces TaxID=2593676 RepID=UPI00145EECF2|nr:MULTISPECIES: hypothetical protein [unclassified Streptomyces]NML49076.1 hypothetical protein [Streptomyces sp. R301]NML77403.1 hypothetical protein [Streptomyces sp. R302]
MKLPLRLAAAGVLVALLAGTAQAAAPWRQVGADARSGVSGLAAEGDGSGTALVVHDNKRSGQQRLSRLAYGADPATVTPLTWDGAEPVDLEAVEAIPGAPGEYLAVAARGIVYRLRVAGTTATVVEYTPLPAIGEGDDVESFALVARDGRFAALWADRGEGPDRPATLYAAPLAFAAWGEPKFGAVTRRPFTAPYPTGAGTRHISDISVTDSGRILVSSASDAGDDGPFDSAVTDAGQVVLTATGRVRISLAARPVPLGTFPGYKTEAVECLPGTGDALLGTDDENRGGHVRTAPYCGG